MWSSPRGQRNLALFSVILAASILPLAGCANDEKITVWTKPNVSEDQRNKDFSLCRRYADQQLAANRGVQQDVQVMNGGVTSGLKPGLDQNLGAYNDAKRYDALVRDCMTEAGYRAVK
ncbi:MAG TPA: hypothetical protein VF920_02850 [Dongiaceae bacterium]